jgi:hypothetical protein
MPTYVFQNTETKEIFEKVLKMSEFDQYKLDNPTHIRFHNSAPAFADPVRIGVRKTDTGFKEVLQKIHEKTAGSTLNTHSSQI